ncbi:MAG: nucleoside triphosphate pyrophosphohydrolase, partial [Pikeienuella sp.]
PDELGDLLLQVIYHSQIGAETGAFSLDDVIAAISDKMIRRHPHVFGDWAREDFVAGSWEKLKDREKGAATRESVLDDVPTALPGLTRAVKLQKRAARVGFDWPETGDVLKKIQEESAELAEAIDNADPDEIEDEFADVLFSVANLGRHLKIDPEKAMRRVNAKFERRFRYVESTIRQAGRSLEEATLDEMEELWKAAKIQERQQK